MEKDDIDEKILTLYNEQRWKDIVYLNCTSYTLNKSKLFWVLPTINDLQCIKEVVVQFDLAGLISIGCGCGLFEWLFQKYSDLDVIGIEVDRSWWCSKYSPHLFLENMIFDSANNKSNYSLPAKYALLFCYFNNASAFCEYIENYEGNLVFVIGPKSDQHRWTDPMPLDVKFNDRNWKLINKKEMERTSDYIAVYRRIAKQ